MKKVRDLAKEGRTAMVVGTKAYDFTDFMNEHPGGPDYLRKNSGKVATEEFIASHPIDIIERTLSASQYKSMYLGDVILGTVEPGDKAVYPVAGAHALPHNTSVSSTGEGGPKPSLESCLNVYDFEAIAGRTLSETALAYYSSGGDDEITLRENHSAFHRLWLRPRVMVNVKSIDMKTDILGHASSFPVFLSAVAMCKMGCPEEGEMAWMRGAAAEGCIYMIPTLSGFSFDEIIGSRAPGQPIFFQLYVNPDREKTRLLVQKAEAAGCSALFITCDAPQLGNREKDRRVKVSHSGAAVQGGVTGGKAEGTSKALTSFIDPSLCWDDIPWFRSITSMKIILKGVGTAEDAVRALEAGCDGVLLSNHGGRQLDFARSALEVLPETMAALRAHPAYSPAGFEVYVDGGVRRGTDIFKALALGAKAVGIGRPALYAMSAFGSAGVQRLLAILKSELEMTMRLMGTPTLKDITPGMVITDNLHSHISTVPSDFLQQHTYIPAVTQAQRNGFSSPQLHSPAMVSGAPAPPPSLPPVAATAEAAAAAVAVPSPSLELLSKFTQGLTYGIFTSLPSLLVHRTSLVLLLYCVLHAGGNLLFFAGSPTYNAYAELLQHHPLVSRGVKAFEVYLTLSAVGHIGAAGWQTWKKGSFAFSSLTNARLLLSGAAISAFTVIHLQHFRFSPVVGVPGGDLHKEVRRVMAQPYVAVGYTLSILALGLHSLWGWEKAALKMKANVDSSGKPALGEAAKSLGSVLIGATTLAFVSVTVYAYVLGNRGD